MNSHLNKSFTDFDISVWPPTLQNVLFERTHMHARTHTNTHTRTRTYHAFLSLIKELTIWCQWKLASVSAKKLLQISRNLCRAGDNRRFFSKRRFWLKITKLWWGKIPLFLKIKKIAGIFSKENSKLLIFNRRVWIRWSKRCHGIGQVTIIFAAFFGILHLENVAEAPK